MAYERERVAASTATRGSRSAGSPSRGQQQRGLAREDRPAPRVSEDDAQKLNRIADARLMALAAQQATPELQQYHPSIVAQPFSNVMRTSDFAEKMTKIPSMMGLLSAAMPLSRQEMIPTVQAFLRRPDVAITSRGAMSAPIMGNGRQYGTIGMGEFGNVSYSGMPYAGISKEDPYYNLIAPPAVERGENVVAPVVDTTGQARCPEGYEFDENLNACRKITPTEYTAMTMPSVPAGRYARMGLLDQPPAGLLEAGFGSPADFAGANLAFRRATAPMSTYFTDPRSYEGYTLI